MSSVITRGHLDRSEKLIVVERWQDVEPIIEHNKKLQSIEQRGDGFRHTATIPNIFLEKWMAEEWKRGNKTMKLFDEEFNKMVKRKLDDPDYRFLRTDK